MKKSIITALTAMTLLAGISSPSVSSNLEVTPNIFTGGYSVYDGGSRVTDITPNIFTGGWTIRNY